MRRATSSLVGLLARARRSRGSSSSGSDASIVGGRPVTIASRLDSMPASSFSIGVDERVDAVAQQLVGDVVQVDARVGQRLQVGRRVLVGGRAA